MGVGEEQKQRATGRCSEFGTWALKKEAWEVLCNAGDGMLLGQYRTWPDHQSWGGSNPGPPLQGWQDMPPKLPEGGLSLA